MRTRSCHKASREVTDRSVPFECPFHPRGRGESPDAIVQPGFNAVVQLHWGLIRAEYDMCTTEPHTAHMVSPFREFALISGLPGIRQQAARSRSRVWHYPTQTAPRQPYQPEFEPCHAADQERWETPVTCDVPQETRVS